MRLRWLLISLFFAFNTMLAANSGKWGAVFVTGSLLLLFLAIGIWDSYRPPANWELKAEAEDTIEETESQEAAEEFHDSSI